MSTPMIPLIFRGGLSRIFVATTYTVRADGRTVVHVKHDVTDQIMSLQGGFRVGHGCRDRVVHLEPRESAR